MHKEAKEGLRIRFKVTVLEYARHAGATKPAENLMFLAQHFTAGNKNTIT